MINLGKFPSLTLTLIAGIAVRLIMPIWGNNYDMDSYRIVADIVAHGGNVYAETARYNYGPIWFLILHTLDALPWGNASTLIALHWKVTVFLTMVDVGIFWVLFRLYGSRVAAFFFLSPISIIITGYHSQFDNLAILLGLLSVITIENSKKYYHICFGLILVGLSLSVKHILFIFPIWLAFKEDSWSKKIISIFIPYIIFLSGFLFYLVDGADGILKNVFLYRSLNNAPFWSLFAPNILYKTVSPVILFIITLIVLGLYWRPKGVIESLNLYTISLVVFSSAIVNQYLAICTPAIATQWNGAYAIYTMVGTLFLSGNEDGLHMAALTSFFGFKGWYQVLITLLSIGLLITSVEKQRMKKIYDWIRYILTWLLRQLQVQFKVRW